MVHMLHRYKLQPRRRLLADVTTLAHDRVCEPSFKGCSSSLCHILLEGIVVCMSFVPFEIAAVQEHSFEI